MIKYIMIKNAFKEHKPNLYNLNLIYHVIFVPLWKAKHKLLKLTLKNKTKRIVTNLAFLVY